MMFRRCVWMGLCVGTGSILLSVAIPAHGANEDLNAQLETLRQEKATLQETVRKQESLIENLSQRVGQIENAATKQTAIGSQPEPTSSRSGREGVSLGRLKFSGEGAVAIFDSQRNGAFPNAEFRVDEAKLFVEAPVWDDVYLFSELNLASRTSDSLDLNLGELYLDFEDISKLWNVERLLNSWAGRFHANKHCVVLGYSCLAVEGEVTVDFTLGIKNLPRY